LSVKKDVVALYFDFLAAPNVTVSDIRTDTVTYDDQDSSDNDENEKDSWKKQHVRTIKAFLIDYNCVQNPGHQLHHDCLFKWLKAYKRGEFEDWGGLNDLSKSNAKAQKIMCHIYRSIKERDPDTAYWNKIVRKSQISPEDKYGVIAMRFVPRGTVLASLKVIV
jgi:hypothetical protein